MGLETYSGCFISVLILSLSGPYQFPRPHEPRYAKCDGHVFYTDTGSGGEEVSQLGALQVSCIGLNLESQWPIVMGYF